MNELLQIYGTLPHANSLVNGLLESMFDRFNGMLQFVNFSTAMGPSFVPQKLADSVKFNDVFYLVAPFFDPTIKNEWIAGECHHISEDQKQQLHEKNSSLILEELTSISQQKTATVPAEQVPAPNTQVGSDVKKPKLLAYKATVVVKPSAVLTPREEILQYLLSSDILDTEVFWYKYKHTFPLLYELYTKILCVVVSGSPVERVFSVAGNLLRPRRSRMGAKVLSALVFLKCNVNVLSSVM